MAWAGIATSIVVRSDDFKRMPIFIPPPAEQAAIVRFLDWATGGWSGRSGPSAR